MPDHSVSNFGDDIKRPDRVDPAENKKYKEGKMIMYKGKEYKILTAGRETLLVEDKHGEIDILFIGLNGRLKK